MMGGMFAGTEEAPGEVILYQGRSYKSYRGMGSSAPCSRAAPTATSRSRAPATPMPTSWCPRASKAACPTRARWFHRVPDGRRPARQHGLLRLRHIAEMHNKAEFVEITTAGIRESHVHDVQITKEAPNYRAD
jgi:IMP dehydrogenase